MTDDAWGTITQAQIDHMVGVLMDATNAFCEAAEDVDARHEPMQCRDWWRALALAALSERARIYLKEDHSLGLGYEINRDPKDDNLPLPRCAESAFGT
jgi:hypothetical protein